VDVSGPLAVASRSRCLRALQFFLALIIVGAWTACYSPEPRGVTGTTQDSFKELKASIVRLRHLPLAQDIVLRPNAPEPPVQALSGAFENDYGPSSVRQVEQAYKRIGLLEENADFLQGLADYNRLEQMAFYDRHQHTTSLGVESIRLGLAFAPSDPGTAREIPVLFGIVHALQEQNFHSDEKLLFLFLEDRRLAFRSVAKGDATLLVLAHESSEKTVPTSLVDIQIIARLGAALEKMAADLPSFLRHKLVFPYREGSQFVLWAYTAKGWQGVNRLYADPPLSTAQILHPERYYIRRENPLRIFPWGLVAQMKGNPVFEQTLGESLIRLLTASVRSSQESAQIASAWQGDQMTTYAVGGNLVTAWFSAWETDLAARKFFRAYQEALATQRRVRFFPSLGGQDSLQAALDDGRSLVLQAKGSLVLFLDGLPSARSMEIADAAWRDLEIDTEPIRTPLDLGRGPLQLSRMSR